MSTMNIRRHQRSKHPNAATATGRTAAALAAALLLAGAGTAAKATDLTVAVVGPMTGALASIGEQLRRGAEAAATAINAKGGVAGKKLVLAIEDDQCDPKTAVAVANRIVSRGLQFVVGHACSGSTIPASGVYADAGALMMTPSSSSPVLTDEAAARGWPTILRLYGRDDAQGAFTGKWMAAHVATKKIAIVDDRSAYGKGLADEVKKALNAAGVQEALRTSLTAGEKDYSALITRLREQQIEFIYFGGYHMEGGLLLRQSRERQFAATLMMGDSIANQEFWQITGDAGVGTLFSFPQDPNTNPAAAAAVAAIKQGGGNAEGFTLYTYAALQAIAAGIERAGNEKPAAVAAALRSGAAVPTALGEVAFDAKGDLKDPRYIVFEWQGGKYAPLVEKGG